MLEVTIFNPERYGLQVASTDPAEIRDFSLVHEYQLRSHLPINLLKYHPVLDSRLDLSLDPRMHSRLDLRLDMGLTCSWT